MAKEPVCSIGRHGSDGDVWIECEGNRSTGFALRNSLKRMDFRATLETIRCRHSGQGEHRLIFIRTNAPLSEVKSHVLDHFENFIYCDVNWGTGEVVQTDADSRVVWRAFMPGFKGAEGKNCGK